MTCATLVWPTAFRRTVLPTVEPLSLAEAKAYLRVTEADQDVEIAALLAAARARAEGYLERALLTQTWEARLDGFWGGADLLLPYPNLLAITSIKYHADETDALTTVDASVYEADLVNVPGRVRLKPLQEWPTPYARAGAVQVLYTAGYGATAAAVPTSVLQAVRLLLAHYDRHREAVVMGTISSELPEGIKALLELERVPWND